MSRLDQLNAFLNDSPNDPFVHYAIAQEYRKMRDLTLAHSKYIELVENYPNYVATYYHLGKLFEKLSSFDKALHIYEKGISVARHLHKQHELRELQGVLNQLKDELE